MFINPVAGRRQLILEKPCGSDIVNGKFFPVKVYYVNVISLRETNMVAEVTPEQAWQILQDNPETILLDVRSKVEFDYVGHPIGAVNVPLQEPPHWQTDPAFAETVIEQLGEASKDVTVLTLCRSGKRSMLAATLLEEKGYKQTVNIAEGFEGDPDENRHRGNLNGWRFHKLPWEQT